MHRTTSKCAFGNSACLLGRVALGVSFLSAVADRFGFWGPAGAQGIAWGDFSHFTAYVAVLNPWLPSALMPVLAWVATLAEIGAGLLLLAGLFVRPAALFSGCLLVSFGLSMTFTIGVKAPLDYSVFSAAAAAFFVAQLGGGAWSLDALRRSRRRAESA